MRRSELVLRLSSPPLAKLTLLDAPAGWGKTTLLAEWAAGDRDRSFAWLSLERGDNDPTRFWSYVLETLDRAAPGAGSEAERFLGAPGASLTDVVLPVLLNGLEALDGEIVLVLDDYHLISSAAIHEGVAFLVDHLPRSLRLVLATRTDPLLPLARLRAHGELLEIRAAELGFTREETGALLNDVLALDLPDELVTRLQERTEGWAAGLHLAALSLRHHADPRAFVLAFTGDDRHIVDYLGAEVLANETPQTRSFLLRTSILERLSGPLCDAVTGEAGSAQTLAELERSNHFVLALDPRHRWYRYHQLFAALLRHELRQAEPELVPDLHRRACDWYRSEGSVPEAIRHATAAGDLEDAAELVAEQWNAFFNQGRLATVAGWLDALPPETVAADPRLCIARAWLAMDAARLDEVGEWIDAADAAMEEPDSTELELLRAVHRFKIGRLSDANRAADRATDDPFWRTVAYCILGATAYWSGRTDAAVDALENAASTAASAGNDLARCYSLGYLALLRAEQDRLDEAEQLSEEVATLTDEPGVTEHFVSMLAHLARAATLERRGSHSEAEAAAARALELGRRGAGRLEVAAALLGLARLRRDRTLLDEARAILALCEETGLLAERLASAERTPARTSARTGDELTEREVDVLRLLKAGRSRSEVADALYVTANTVKSHVRTIYRKLGASTREEAVERAHELGLL